MPQLAVFGLYVVAVAAITAETLQTLVEFTWDNPTASHAVAIPFVTLVLIYLNRAIQERVIETFHFALRPGSYLFLGTSESPDGSNDLFLRFDNNAHVYESRTVTSRLALPLTDSPMTTLRAQPRMPEPRPPDRIMPADLHQRLLEHYAPPSVIVTE